VGHLIPAGTGFLNYSEIELEKYADHTTVNPQTAAAKNKEE